MTLSQEAVWGVRVGGSSCLLEVRVSQCFFPLKEKILIKKCFQMSRKFWREEWF